MKLKPITRGTIKLAQAPTRVAAEWPNAKSEELLQENVRQLGDQQLRLYASGEHALLVILQGMDAAGKDGVIKHVMSGVNPQGCEVSSFVQLSASELRHDFLWRSACKLPERGRIGIFNRSYYEDVLVVRVHPQLLQAQHLPLAMSERADVWSRRFQSIRDFERHLHRNGTRVLKFFLHMSKEEQRERLLLRTQDPRKMWKAKLADVAERTLWDEYMRAYEDCINATSSRHAPWYVVPADHKPAARLWISDVILDTLRKLKMQYPRADAAQRRSLRTMRQRLSEQGARR